MPVCAKHHTITPRQAIQETSRTFTRRRMERDPRSQEGELRSYPKQTPEPLRSERGHRVDSDGGQGGGFVVVQGQHGIEAHHLESLPDHLGGREEHELSPTA